MFDKARFRAHFPVIRNWAFLDHAAVAPLPDVAASALQDYASNLAENGIAGISRWTQRVREVRQLAAQLIQAANVDDICFIPSTTYGIGMVAEGFPWQLGDNVVTAAEEYPSNLYPWMNLQDRGVSVRLVRSRGNRVDIDDIRNAIDSRTKVLAISAVEFASGFRNDLSLLGQLCDERDLFFFVDAIQALGVIPINVEQLGVDGLAADGHKWLLGPEGAGVAYVKREWAERMRAVMVGWNSVVNSYDFNTIDFRLKPHAGKWEGGTPNVAGISALGSSLTLLLEFGIQEIWKEVESLTNELMERSASAGLEIFNSRLPADRSGIVSLNKPGADAVSLMKKCRTAGVIVNARHHRLRLSPHAYNTLEEIDRFVEAMR